MSTKFTSRTSRKANSVCKFNQFLLTAQQEGFNNKTAELAWQGIVEFAKGARYSSRHALNETVTVGQLGSYVVAGRIPTGKHGHMRGDKLECAQKVAPALLASL